MLYTKSLFVNDYTTRKLDVDARLTNKFDMNPTSISDEISTLEQDQTSKMCGNLTYTIARRILSVNPMDSLEFKLGDFIFI